MIFHSIIPIEIVMGNMDKQMEGYMEMNYLGERVQVSPLENNKYVIRRLIATSPQAFLNPRLQPGSIIDKS